MMHAAEPTAAKMIQAPWGVTLKAVVPEGEPMAYISSQPHSMLVRQAQ